MPNLRFEKLNAWVGIVFTLAVAAVVYAVVLSGKALSATLILDDGTQIELPGDVQVVSMIVVPKLPGVDPNADGCVGYPHNSLNPLTADYDPVTGLIDDSDPCTFLGVRYFRVDLPELGSRLKSLIDGL